LTVPQSAPTVLVVLHEEQMGGASIAVLRCVDLLERLGWHFAFWAPRPGEVFDHLSAAGRVVDGAERPIAYSLPAARLPPGVVTRARATPGYVRAFRRWLAEVQPALVHANSHATLVEAAIAHAKGLPTIFHVHEMFGRGLKWWLGRRAAMRVADEIVAVSRATAQRLELRGENLRIVRNGVRIPLVAAPLRPGPVLTIGTVGVISRRKGSDLFVQAAELIARTHPELRFEMVGSATAEPLDAEWGRGVLAEARRNGVRHLERVDVDKRLLDWDVFVLPSRRDPFPLSALEAMAAGLPVVGTAVDGIIEQLTPQTGVIVPPDDPHALAAVISELAGSPERRQALGRAARVRATSEFSLERQASGLDQAYRAAMGGC
jgi:glycosyltransferase involved in cell wall biosynthesis